MFCRGGLILALKHAYLDGDGYRDGVTGAAIYAAVLAGVRDAGEFQTWLRKRTGATGTPPVDGGLRTQRP